MSQNGSTHEHIVSVRWLNPADGNAGQSTRAEMVRWIDDDGSAKVSDGDTIVSVGTVHPTNRAAFIRTYADKTWADNLLALPRY